MRFTITLKIKINSLLCDTKIKNYIYKLIQHNTEGKWNDYIIGTKDINSTLMIFNNIQW